MKPYSDKKKEEIVRLKKEGLSFRQVARVAKVSRGTVEYWYNKQKNNE